MDVWRWTDKVTIKDAKTRTTTQIRRKRWNTLRQEEFPEARIYEETLNILLYESHDGRGPDNALLEATGGAAGRSHHLDEDEERERIERVRRIHVKRPDDRTHHHQWPFSLNPLACVSVPGQSLHHTCALHHPAPLCLTFTLILPAFFFQESTTRWVSYNSV